MRSLVSSGWGRTQKASFWISLILSQVHMYVSLRSTLARYTGPPKAGTSVIRYRKQRKVQPSCIASGGAFTTGLTKRLGRKRTALR
eukprot:7993260-Ditylum_brightwellii.AAC.1